MKKKSHHCKVVTVHGQKRKICRTAKGRITSNKALQGLGVRKAKRRSKKR